MIKELASSSVMASSEPDEGGGPGQSGGRLVAPTDVSRGPC